MSGHSKWSTIKRAKGAADAKRGQTFTKVANAIALATKEGGSGDPEANPRVRLLLEQARAANMPKENIQRAIDRGLGKLPGQTLEEVMYEGFGPLKVAFIVEAVTDNKLRTLQEMKNAFDRAGGALASAGAVSYMFEKKGEVKVKGKGGASDDEMLELIDLGADDVEEFSDEGVQRYLVYTDSSLLAEMSKNITQSGFAVESAELTFKPTMSVELKTKEDVDRVLAFTEKIEDNDDVQKVYANFDIPDTLM